MTKSIKFLISVAIVATIVVGYMLIDMGFFNEARGSTGYDPGGSEITSGTTDSTDWIDLQDFNFPSRIMWELDIIAVNEAGSLWVEIQTSNHQSLTNRGRYAQRLVQFSAGKGAAANKTPWDTTFAVADTGSAYFAFAPRDGIVTDGDSSYILAPVHSPGRYVRLFFKMYASSNVWTLRQAVTFSD